MVSELGEDRAAFHQGDATTKEGVEQTVEAAVERFGRIDIMVNNAGGAERLAPLVDLYDEDWDLVMKWNLYSTFWGTRAALRHMLPQKYGRIINISSVEGKHGKPVLTAYVAAKHAINGLTKAVAKEVGTQGVTVNADLPGAGHHRHHQAQRPATAQAMGITFDEMVALFAAESAIKRPNTLDEVAAVAVLLASDVGGRHHRRDLQRRRRNGSVLSVVGTHFPDDRDVVESALQRDARGLRGAAGRPPGTERCRGGVPGGVRHGARHGQHHLPGATDLCLTRMTAPADQLTQRE